MEKLSFIETIVIRLANDFVILFGFCSRRVTTGASASGEYTYDTSLVTLHSYLGGRPLFANIPFQFFIYSLLERNTRCSNLSDSLLRIRG